MEIVNITILEATDMLCNYNTEKLLGLKDLKRNAYGYRNFHRFRNRILHMFSRFTLIWYKVVASKRLPP
jgi:hypothetical protein